MKKIKKIKILSIISLKDRSNKVIKKIATSQLIFCDIFPNKNISNQ